MYTFPNAIKKQDRTANVCLHFDKSSIQDLSCAVWEYSVLNWAFFNCPCPTTMAACERCLDNIKLDTDRDTKQSKAERYTMRQKGRTPARASVSTAGCNHCMWQCIKEKTNKQTISNCNDAMTYWKANPAACYTNTASTLSYQSSSIITEGILFNSSKGCTYRFVSSSYVCKQGRKSQGVRGGVRTPPPQKHH